MDTPIITKEFLDKCVKEHAPDRLEYLYLRNIFKNAFGSDAGVNIHNAHHSEVVVCDEDYISKILYFPKLEVYVRLKGAHSNSSSSWEGDLIYYDAEYVEPITKQITIYQKVMS